MRRNNRTVHQARGEIVLAQEDRFRLQTADGRSFLITLGAGSRSSIEDLERLVKSHRMVNVRYEGEPEAGAVAVEIQLERD